MVSGTEAYSAAALCLQKRSRLLIRPIEIVASGVLALTVTDSLRALATLPSTILLLWSFSNTGGEEGTPLWKKWVAFHILSQAL